MPALQRITTVWVETEDRLRLTGEGVDGSTACLWLTRRLADRLLPLLLDWLDGNAQDDARASLMQEFAQEAARGALVPQAAVPPDAGDAVLLQAVTVTRGEHALGLTFRASEAPDDARSWDVTLEQQPLRQWLAIVHDQYRKADWPMDLWPAWITVTPAQPAAALH